MTRHIIITKLGLMIYNFIVEIIGKGAHGAMPSNSIDPIVCGASIIQNLQHILLLYVLIQFLLVLYGLRLNHT